MYHFVEIGEEGRASCYLNFRTKIANFILSFGYMFHIFCLLKMTADHRLDLVVVFLQLLVE